MSDPFTEILRDLRLERSHYARSELSAPWGLSFLAENGPSFHVILAGRCWLRRDTERIPLQAGDLVVLPHGDAHHLADAPEGPVTLLKDLPSQHIGEHASLLSFGGGGERSVLICGGVRFAGPIAHPLIGMLPKVLLLHREDLEGAYGWLDGTLTMLEAEALALRPGGAALMIHLADILVLQTIRVWLERIETRQVGWIRALTDPEIGPVLAMIHRCPEEAWTVTSLAAEAHLSRSAFTERFTRLVGMPPMHYVAQWQMHLASSWLREGRLSPSEVGHRLGYSSEAAFSRAFKRHLHLPPRAVQRRK